MAIGNYITTSEAAEVLGVSNIRVRQFVAEGRLTRYMVGRTILLDRDEVKEFADQERPTGRPRKNFSRSAR